jgi:hypothetical protein
VIAGLLIVLLDFAAIAGLIVAVVVAAQRLRAPPSANDDGTIFRRWRNLITLVAALVLLVVGNGWFMKWSDDKGKPVPAHFVGTWTDRDGAKLRVRADGTFTASKLPADANDPAGYGKPRPTRGRGTWQVTSGDGTWYVLFTFSTGSKFRLDAWSFASRGHTSSVMFTYLFPRYDGVDTWVFYRP